MAIPEHVKRQAMAAVSSPETRGMIRMTQGDESPAASGGKGVQAPTKTRTAEPFSRQQDQASSDPKPLSPEVKRQAMAAVSNPETRAMIRMTQGNESPAEPRGTGAGAPAKARTAEPSSRQLDLTPRDRQTVSPEVGQQAKATVSRPANPQKELSHDKDVMAQIRLVSVRGASSPQHSPNAESQRITQTVAQKIQMGQDVDTFQRSMTKDDFGRD